ncbi:MAG: peptidoglycan DD-metalloendopeptidase family protein [Bacteroidota bacterium]
MKNKSSTFIKVVMKSFAIAGLAFTTPVFAQQENDVPVQELQPYNEPSKSQQGICVTKAEMATIRAQVQQFKATLEADGKLDPNRTASIGPHAFRWPLAPAKHYHQFTTYYISNYVDLNSITTGLHADETGESLEDYHCGNRTYDVLSTGYDHTGIDIAIGPFGWTMMEHEDVDVVAAEGGYIAYRLDGEFDHTCAMGTPNVYHGNWIGITHSDGSTTYYMHMKSGSVTSKIVGDHVSAGEYLGKVGSSGNSTGPHLHFQVEDNIGIIVDPFQNGSCATGDNASLWANEEPYFNPQIVAASTLSAPWTDAVCDTNVSPAHAYNGNVPYCNHFNAGDMIWFTAAVRDIFYPQVVNIKFYNPSGTLIYNFNYTESNLQRELRTIAPNFIIAPNVAGNYKMQVSFNGVTRAHYFTVGCPGSVTLNSARASNYGYISGGSINSTDVIAAAARNVQYQTETFIQLNTGFTATNGCEFTAYIDNCTVGSTKLEDITSATFDFNIVPNPANDKVSITPMIDADDATCNVSIYNATGSEAMKSSTEDFASGITLNTADLANGVYFISVTIKSSTGEVKSTKKLIINH